MCGAPHLHPQHAGRSVWPSVILVLVAQPDSQVQGFLSLTMAAMADKANAPQFWDPGFPNSIGDPH